MRSPLWSCRLEELSSESYSCLPLFQSVTLDKKPPALGLSSPIYLNLYSALRIGLGAMSEFTEGNMRASCRPLGLLPSSHWPARVGCGQGPLLGGEPACTLGHQTRGGAEPAARPCSGCQRAGGLSPGYLSVGSSTFVPGERVLPTVHLLLPPGAGGEAGS